MKLKSFFLLVAYFPLFLLAQTGWSPTEFQGIDAKFKYLGYSISFEGKNWEEFAFEKDNSEAIFESSTCKTGITLKTKSPDYFSLTQNIPLKTDKDFEISLTLRSEQKLAGLVFGKKGEKQYEFLFNPANQFTIRSTELNRPVDTYQPIQPSKALISYEWNTLTVRKFEKRYYFFINGTLAYQMDWKAFFDTNVGVLVPPFAEISLKSLEIYSLSRSTDASTYALPLFVTHTTKDENRNLVLVSGNDIKQEPSPSPTPHNNTPTSIGKYHALLIAIQDYEDNGIADLDKPIQDAQQLYEVLSKNYTIDKENITFLKNPKRNEITQTLDRLLEVLSKDDNLLVFYAGHGYWDEKLKQGYWFPADAQRNNRGTWLANNDIKDYMKGIATQHTLLITDACFSGSIFKTRSAFNMMQTSIAEMYKLPSRKAMTSGAMKAVPDNSVFIEYLVKRLNDNTEKYLSAEQLFSSFKTAVINNSSNGQVPQFGTISESGDEGGDFIFVKR